MSTTKSSLSRKALIANHPEHGKVRREYQTGMHEKDCRIRTLRPSEK